MKKFVLSIAILFAASATTLKAQDFCGSLNSILGEAQSGFETQKGKYTAAEYDGSWAANTKLAGSTGAVIEENSGWYIATYYVGNSEAAAMAKWNEICNKVAGCTSGYTKWNFNNAGEHMQTKFFSENGNEKLNADGGQYGQWGKSRDYDNWDATPKGKTVEVELRKKNGSEGYEVRVKIYYAS